MEVGIITVSHTQIGAPIGRRVELAAVFGCEFGVIDQRGGRQVETRDVMGNGIALHVQDAPVLRIVDRRDRLRHRIVESLQLAAG
ncbi:hypothetical protein AB0F17_37260 [Nonomuraea sp. NPDC026600]|uniref:hypothetical protein n=1 Tax=Nonomuraea sp. NPDC026600 TaxID=3155363 RepID=UPI0033E87AD0